METHRLLIGSVGDDIHSVGMSLLTLAFREAGLVVENLGISNDLDDFFFQAHRYDAIFISCLNGHVDLYLETFPWKLKHFSLCNDEPRLWYLGGNLSVNGNAGSVVRKYRQMGFDFVAPKPLDWRQILERLNRDFHNRGIKPRALNGDFASGVQTVPNLESVDDTPMADEEFLRTRDKILASWPTGAEVRTTEVKRNHAVPSQNLNSVIGLRQSRPYQPLLQPRTGVAHVDDEIAILRMLEGFGSNVSSIQLDAASRKNMYAEAAEGVRRTVPGKTSFLNGYPVPVHGVNGVRRILQSIETPFQIRAGSPDHRLVYEIALAGGASSVEGGFICYLFPYDKRTSPVENLANWKYVDKLTGMYYQQHGIVINREYFGPLTTTLIEPSIPICINIVQALLSAMSGCRCISVGIAEQGNRAQDIAAIRVVDELTRRYLAKYGFPNCTVSTVYHHYMAGFPADPEKARQLILNSSTTGALARATRFLIKTPVEAYKIPTSEDNAHALRLTQEGVYWASDVKPDPKAILREKRLLEKQVVAMMGAIEELGNGSLARGAIRAFQAGILDIPFSPSGFNRNQLLTVRDCDGAIRFSNPELLPFDARTSDFHRERVHKRMIAERRNRVSELISSDLTRIWRGDFLTWPLDGTYVV